MPSNHKRLQEEHLEHIWYLGERNQDRLGDLIEGMAGDYDQAVLDGLIKDGLVQLDEDGRVSFTAPGRAKAEKIIRAHRLAERLLYDVIGGEFETAACEFEHTVSADLIDGICTLLGHPRRCPHGLPIPEGDCCRASAKISASAVEKLTEMGLGQTARVAYINCPTDKLLHRLDGLQIQPGSEVKLHQRNPCFVVECEGANIALDEEVASNVCVWRPEGGRRPETGEAGEAAPGAPEDGWGRYGCRKGRRWWRRWGRPQ